MSSTAGPSAGQQSEPTAPDPASSPTPDDAAHEDPAARRRRGLQKSARDMVLSVLVIVGFVVVIVALVPRPNAVPLQAVNVSGVAQQVAARLSFAPAVPAVPAGWVPTSAGLQNSSADGIVTWHIGYQTPDGHYASIEQAAAATTQWENTMDSGGALRPTQRVDGTAWEQRFKDVRDVTALIHRGSKWTTMITSKGGGLPNAEVLARGIPVSQR